jgi:hypothetical protein
MLMSGPEESYFSGVAGSPADIGRQEVGSSNIAKPVFGGVLWRVEFLSRTYRMSEAETMSSPVI